jgi:hypothetical protein
MAIGDDMKRIALLFAATVLTTSIHAKSFVVIYKTADGAIHSWHQEGTQFPKGVADGLAVGTTEAADGTETNISQVADLQSVQSIGELIQELVDVLLDETLTKQEKKAAAKALSDAIDAKTKK